MAERPKCCATSQPCIRVPPNIRSSSSLLNIVLREHHETVTLHKIAVHIKEKLPKALDVKKFNTSLDVAWKRNVSSEVSKKGINYTWWRMLLRRQQMLRRRKHFISISLYVFMVDGSDKCDLTSK